MIDLTNANETATQNNQPDSTHQEPSNCQPIVNLFISETEYQENCINRSKSIGRLKKKIQNVQREGERIKENILQDRYNKRVNGLKEVTQQNVKLYLRLQSKRSQYRFRSLQKVMSCDLQSRQLSRVQINKTVETNNWAKRCQSAKRALSLRGNSIKSSIASSKVTELNVLQHEKNMGVNKQNSERKYAYQCSDKQNKLFNSESSNKKQKEILSQIVEKKLITKKIGLKIPLSDLKTMKSRTNLNAISAAQFDDKLKPKTNIRTSYRNLTKQTLSQRKFNHADPIYC